MYLSGYRSKKNGQAIAGFIGGKKLTKKIIQYAKDASVSNELIFYGNADNEKEEEWLLATKVKPGEFIEWAKTLPIRIPILEANDNKEVTGKESLSERERQTLYKMIIGMATDAYGYDPNASRSPFHKELEGILDGLGISVSDDTIRDKLKEAAELLPRGDK